MKKLTKLDAQYFITNLEQILEDLFPYESPEYNFSSDIISEVKRFYPNNEDITQGDIGRSAHSLHNDYYEELLIDEVDEIIQILWDSIQ